MFRLERILNRFDLAGARLPGVAGDMFRLERILNRFDRTVQLMARAVIRLLEREDPELASGLSKALSSSNGEDA